MRVHFVNRFYWPAEPATAQLLGDLAEALAVRGDSVHVVTGHSRPGLRSEESRNGVFIRRVGPVMATTQNLLRRTIDFARFRAAAAQALKGTLQARDIVVCLTDPPLAGVAVQAVAHARRAHVVHWVQDIYPEIFHAVSRNPLSWFAAATLTGARNRAWRQSAACVTLGEDMAAVICAAGVDRARVQVIPNWAPTGVAPASPATMAARRKEWDIPPQMFVVGYSGNLGRVHDLDHVLDVAAHLESEQDILFLFIGVGAAFAGLEAEATRRKLRNIRFLPPQPRDELATTLSVPDVHLISLREGCERFVFPSKLYGAAAVGRPVLVLASPRAEIARLVAGANMGVTFPASAVMEIAQQLRALAVNPARCAAMSTAALRFGGGDGGWARSRAAWMDLLGRLDAAA